MLWFVECDLILGLEIRTFHDGFYFEKPSIFSSYKLFIFSNGDTGCARQATFSAATKPQKRFVTIQVTVKHLKTLQQMVLLLNYC